MAGLDYFKREQIPGVFHYIRVYGGPGKTKQGYQVVLNFLNDKPIISVEHNYECDPSGLTGTWCNYEVGISITKDEYEQAYLLATSNEFDLK